MENKIEEVLNSIYENREYILTAFIAQYGCKPDEVEQVIKYSDNGVIWFVRRKEVIL